MGDGKYYLPTDKIKSRDASASEKDPRPFQAI